MSTGDVAVSVALRIANLIKTANAQAATNGESVKRPKRGKRRVRLRDRTPLDADQPTVTRTPGEAPADVQ
jgi:hypothetical protein